MTVEALLGRDGPTVLTPVTLWELTVFIDAVVCFDWLYCIDNPYIDVAQFNQRLGGDVLKVIPDPDGGMLRRLAVQAAGDGLSNMQQLRMQAGHDAAIRQEVHEVTEAWRQVLGPDFPNDGQFDTTGVDIRLAQGDVEMAARTPLGPGLRPPYDPSGNVSAIWVDGKAPASSRSPVRSGSLEVLIDATHVPYPGESSTDRPPLQKRRQFAANATYRTYVNQDIANALAMPYLPGTLRMPFRRLFLERAGEVQDELVTVACADQIFARRQPSSPLKLPFFTAAVLQRATRREDLWAQMAHMRAQSAAFRRKRADLDRILERSLVSPEAQRIQKAISDEALKLADVGNVILDVVTVALGTVSQMTIASLAGNLKVALDAAQDLSRSPSWARIWRRLFQRHLEFLAQTDSQAIALTNASPQLQQLWDMPNIGGYLDRFASATQQIGQRLHNHH
jgi:hypothetical protein